MKTKYNATIPKYQLSAPGLPIGFRKRRNPNEISWNDWASPTIYIYPENNDGLEASKVACDMLHATLFEMRSPSRITTPSWPSCTVWSSSAFGGLIINHFSLLPHLTLPEWWESQTRMLLRKKTSKIKKLPTCLQFFAAVFTMVANLHAKTSDKFVYKKSGLGKRPWQVQSCHWAAQNTHWALPVNALEGSWGADLSGRSVFLQFSYISFL